MSSKFILERIHLLFVCPYDKTKHNRIFPYFDQHERKKRLFKQRFKNTKIFHLTVFTFEKEKSITPTFTRIRQKTLVDKSLYKVEDTFKIS